MSPRGRAPEPGLQKRFLVNLQGYHICAVSARGVRDLAPKDEEFTNFAIHSDFPALIPENEIWIDERLIRNEAIFYMANALARLKFERDGASAGRAYSAGLEVEKALRETLVGVKYRSGRPHRRVPRSVYDRLYVSLGDPVARIDVWFIEGNLVRSLYKTDYT
jgi:hypothetical protein